MKRSEMLDLIDGILIDHDLPVLQGISKEILGTLEKAGMQPPSRPNDYGALNSQGVVTLINEWEHE